MFLKYIKNLTEYALLYNKNNLFLDHAISYNQLLLNSLYKNNKNNKNNKISKNKITFQEAGASAVNEQKLKELRDLKEKTLKALNDFILAIKNGKKTLDLPVAIGLINGLIEYIKVLTDIVDDKKLETFHGQLEEIKKFLEEY